MKKNILQILRIILIAVLFSGGGPYILFADNSPFGGELYFKLPHPELLAESAVAAPPGSSPAGPYSVNVNPALSAGMQRFAADFGYTGIFDSETSSSFGSALHFGVVFPTRWGNFSGAVQGAFNFPQTMPLGDTIVFRGGFSRDITDEFYVGASVFAGFPVSGGDFAAAVDLGILRKIGNLAFLNDAQFGAALSNLGKTFNTNDDGESDDNSHYPGMFTPKVGFSACFFEYKQFQAYFAVGLSFPSFNNIILNVGLELSPIKNLLISSSYDIDFGEISSSPSQTPRLPAVSLSYKFILNTGKAEILANQGWAQSDLNVTGTWQSLGRGLQAVSFGAAANFGTRDNDAPQIDIWGDD